MAYSIVIDSVDRTADVINLTPVITEYINNQQNTLSFALKDRSAVGIPSPNQTITITLDSGDVIFGGIIDRIRKHKKNQGSLLIQVECVDYMRILDTKLVHEVYENTSDRDIIINIIDTFAPGLGIDTSAVQGSQTIEQIVFNYIPVSQALTKLAKRTGYNWSLDYEKNLKYFSAATYSTPWDITDSTSTYDDFSAFSDGSQVKNRIYVKGGNRSSDLTTYREKGDGSKREFVLPDKPHNVTVSVDGVEKTLGIFNIDTGKQWYLNFQEKYVVQDESETILTELNELQVNYNYDIPILIAQNNEASITALGGDPEGIREFAIFDDSITSHQAARARAAAELNEYASSIVEATFRTYEDGFYAGQQMNINLTDYGINEDYIVQQVTKTSQGAGRYESIVKLASAKTLGIIDFLISLMITDKGQIGFDENEAVDELLEINLDSLISDSLLDSLTIDSAGPYRTWSFSGDTSPTKFRWNLAQWK